MKVKQEDIPRLIEALVKMAGTREMAISSKVPSQGGRRMWHLPSIKLVNGRITASYNTITANTLVNAFQKMMDGLEESFKQPVEEAKKNLKDIEKLQVDTMALFEGPHVEYTEDEIVTEENELDTLDRAIQSIEI